MIAILLGLLGEGVLSEKCLGFLLDIMERTRRQRVEPIRYHTFQTGGKGDAQECNIARIDHHFLNVLDGVTHRSVVIKG